MLTVWDRVRELEGSTLATLHRAKPFMVVSVHDDFVRVIPQEGKGVKRQVRRDRIEHIAGLGLQRDELSWRTVKEYPDSRNTSYIAAIVCEVSKPVGSPPTPKVPEGSATAN